MRIKHTGTAPKPHTPEAMSPDMPASRKEDGSDISLVAPISLFFVVLAASIYVYRKKQKSDK